MAEVAGKSAIVKVSGTLTSMVGEATTEDGTTKIYQIANTVKQVLDRTATISVHLYDSDDEAEANTTTTTIKMTDHGLAVGDLIINESRSNAARVVVTAADDDTITVASVSSQNSTDVIAKYPTEAAANYTLNRLNGTVTYAAADTRIIKISGSYLPMSTAAYAHEFSYARGIDLSEITAFGATYKNRLAGLKYASGTLSQFDATSEYYADALVAGSPVVIEFLYQTGADPLRAWALLESVEMAAAIADPQDQVVSFISTDELLDN